MATTTFACAKITHFENVSEFTDIFLLTLAYFQQNLRKITQDLSTVEATMKCEWSIMAYDANG